MKTKHITKHKLNYRTVEIPAGLNVEPANNLDNDIQYWLSELWPGADFEEEIWFYNAGFGFRACEVTQ